MCSIGYNTDNKTSTECISNTRWEQIFKAKSSCQQQKYKYWIFFFSPLWFISRVIPLGNRENYSVMSTTEPPSVFFLPDSRCSTEHVGFTVCVRVCVCLPASTTEPIAIAGRNPWSPIKRSGERSHARLMTPSGRNKRSAACENPGLWDLIDSSLNKHHWYVSHGMFHPQLRRGGCREQLHPLLSLHSRSKMLWW